MPTNHCINQPVCLSTNTTRKLRSQVARLAARDGERAQMFSAIASGDNAALRRAVRRAQDGDESAVLVAIAALLPRMSHVVINRLPAHLWKSAIDDYVTLAYLVILDVQSSELPTHLADKILARTRHR